MTKLEWEEAICPICHCTYSYIKGGYKPSTCNNFDCVHKYLHSPQFKSKGGDRSKQERTSQRLDN